MTSGLNNTESRQRFIRPGRRQHHLLAFLAALWLFPAVGWGESLSHPIEPAEILKTLLFPSDVEVGFTQTQLNPLLKSVSEQQGTMSKTSAAGLIMSVTSPRFEERTLHNGTVTLKRKKRRHHSAGPEYLTRRIELDQNRPSHLVLLALEALLNGRQDILQNHFELNAAAVDDQWTMTLRPKDPAVQEQLTELRFYGNDQHLTRFRSERIDTEGKLSHWLDVHIEPPT